VGDEGKGHFFVNVAKPTYETFRLPDVIDTVFAVELEQRRGGTSGRKTGRADPSTPLRCPLK
jgi:hypothetical protein